MIIPGLFGMNVRGIPFSDSDAGFWTVLILVVVVAGVGTALAWSWRNRS
jgi:Mg2+ and Co2+ transporter CorA